MWLAKVFAKWAFTVKLTIVTRESDAKLQTIYQGLHVQQVSEERFWQRMQRSSLKIMALKASNADTLRKAHALCMWKLVNHCKRSVLKKGAVDAWLRSSRLSPTHSRAPRKPSPAALKKRSDIKGSPDDSQRSSQLSQEFVLLQQTRQMLRERADKSTEDTGRAVRSKVKATQDESMQLESTLRTTHPFIQAPTWMLRYWKLCARDLQLARELDELHVAHSGAVTMANHRKDMFSKSQVR